MYECQMKMIVPTGVGLLVAGLASGICFLLLGSLRKGKGEKNVDDSRCACCLKPFLLGRGVECADCGGRSCRKGCCRWDSIDDAWFCLFCYHSRSWSRRKEKWFRSFGGLPAAESEACENFSTAKSRVYDEGAEDVAVYTELDLAAGGCKERDSMETVREFVEKIVEGLVGNVDDTPIDCLYHHPAYKPATDTPTMAHTALRELVERAVDEARKLPGLGPTVSTALQDDLTFSEQNYEDLLATAILNKVIEKFQNERVDGNSNVLHRSRQKSYHEIEMGLDEGVEEGNSSSEPLSHDDRSSEDSETRGTRHMRALPEPPMSLTIKEQIEEVTTTYTSDEELRCTKANVLDFGNARRVPFPEFGMDIVDPSQDSSDDSQDEGEDLAHVDRITPVESWEENWLFQKRKIQTQSEPVAMLVPNPSSEFRALIGDKDAEDTSDLSEFSAQSDDEADDEDLIEALRQVIPRSRKISESPASNGTNATEDLIEDYVNNGTEINSRINEEDKIFEESPINFIDSAKQTTNSDIPKTPASSSMESNSLSANINQRHVIINEEETRKELSELEEPILDEKSTNGIETLESSVRTECLAPSSVNGRPESNSDEVDCSSKEEIKSNGNAEDEEIIKNDLSSEESSSKCQALAQARADSASEKPSLRIKVNDDIELATPPRPGTIAEREHKKWENAAPIENNPYSEENIQKRLLERQYARRSSDVSGNSTNLQSSPSPPLQIVLGAGRPDFKRFGRDYYINEAKFPKGYSVEESGFFTATSRPNSSMSQHSMSIGSDYEQQERSRSVDTESTCSTSSDSRGKFSSESQHDNTRVPLRRGSMPIEEDEVEDEVETQTRVARIDERRQSLSEVSREDETWNGHHFIDEILERERKNSKNEINAKLNNRGLFEESQKPIKRIDLRAYGFENEINNEKIGERPVRSNRVVNKLDLRNFGYDCGLRRTQSNNNIDRNPSYTRFGGRNVQRKSNLTQQNRRFSAHPSLTSLDGSEDGILTGETLVEDRNAHCQKFGRIMAAKSVPNIGELYSRVDDNHRRGNNRNAIEDIRNDRSSLLEAGDFNRLQNASAPKNNVNNFAAENEEGKRYVEKKLPMPSVRRLAQAFNMTETTNPAATRKTSKATNSSSRERPTTPEIHIIDSPRQMHSLTARSLSREFREGLRLSSNKQVPPSRPSVIPEQNRSADSPPNSIGSIEDVAVIAPGKLKNNIQFWEQLQRHS